MTVAYRLLPLGCLVKEGKYLYRKIFSLFLEVIVMRSDEIERFDKIRRPKQHKNPYLHYEEEGTEFMERKRKEIIEKI